MKKAISLIGFMLIVLSACNQSVNRNLITGAYSRGDGLSCDNTYIHINGEQKNKNIFDLNSKIKVMFDEVTGFNKKAGKAYPGMSMKIVANEKDTIGNFPDLLADLKDGTNLNPLVLNASFTTAPKYFDTTKKYKLYVKIWDKNGDGTFSYELPFTVKN